MGLLSAAIWLPIAVGLVLFALGRDRDANVVRWVALIGAVASLAVTVPLITGFDTTTAAMQFQENLPWIDRFNVRYHLGVDGISMWFVPLTAFITVVVVIAGWQVITDRVATYMGAFLVLSGLMVGVFAALWHFLGWDAAIFGLFVPGFLSSAEGSGGAATQRASTSSRSASYRGSSRAGSAITRRCSRS